MCENYCFLCQESKIVVGHVTQFCPNMKCKKCGIKGHVRGNCPNLNLNMDQKPNGNVCPKGIKSEKSIVLHNDAKLLDFVKNIELSDDIKPKSEIKEELLDVKNKVIEMNEKSSVMHNDTKILDFVKDIEFSDDMEPKFELKKEMYKFKNSRIDLKSNMVDTIMHNDKEIMDFVHDIEFSDTIKPEFEIKEEPIDMESNIKSEVKKETLKIKSSKIDQSSDKIDPIMPNVMNNRFSCNICKYTTERKYNLARHITTNHKGEKPFKCRYCDSRFKSQQRTSDHENNFHKKKFKGFKCPYCIVILSYKTSVPKHIKRHHSKKT